MESIRALKHVAAALKHAELLADEAEDLGEMEITRRIRLWVSNLSLVLDDAESLYENIDPLREYRALAHDVLAAVYGDATLRLEQRLPVDAVAQLTPGGHLDVVERVRYRLRHLPQEGPAVAVRAQLETALATYDACVDMYLGTSSEAQAKKDAAVIRSQAMRIELERVKHALLLRAPPGSEAWKRIKARAVRTKRARWIDETRARQLLAG